MKAEGCRCTLLDSLEGKTDELRRTQEMDYRAERHFNNRYGNDSEKWTHWGVVIDTAFILKFTRSGNEIECVMQ